MPQNRHPLSWFPLLVVPGDAGATAQNIAENGTLLRWGMAGEATIFLIEIGLAAVLYALFWPVSLSLSFGASMARVAEDVVMAAGNLFTSILTLVAISGAGYLTVFGHTGTWMSASALRAWHAPPGDVCQGCCPARS